MYKLIFSILTLIVVHNSYSQSAKAIFLQYNLSINIAEGYLIDAKYDSAILYYRNAFKDMSPLAIDINNALVAAALNSDDLSFKEFAWLMVKKGVGKNFFEKKSEFKKFRSSAMWYELLKKADYEKGKLVISNQELISKVKLLSITSDNFYKIWKNTVPSGSVRENTLLAGQLHSSFKNLIDELINTIDKFGYPTEDKIGANVVDDTFISCQPVFSSIIQYSYSGFDGIGGGSFNAILENALDSGFIKPFFYAKMHDSQNSNYSKRYGTMLLTGWRGKLYSLVNDNIDSINSSRLSIGLPDLNKNADLIEYQEKNKNSPFIFCFSFLKQDLFINTENEILEFLKNHRLYDRKKAY